MTTTYEPTTPIDWPHGHVQVGLTDGNIEECIEVTIHGVRHYLHATTARELQKMLQKALDQFNHQFTAHCNVLGIPRPPAV